MLPGDGKQILRSFPSVPLLEFPCSSVYAKALTEGFGRNECDLNFPRVVSHGKNYLLHPVNSTFLNHSEVHFLQGDVEVDLDKAAL